MKGRPSERLTQVRGVQLDQVGQQRLSQRNEQARIHRLRLLQLGDLAVRTVQVADIGGLQRDLAGQRVHDD